MLPVLTFVIRTIWRYVEILKKKTCLSFSRRPLMSQPLCDGHAVYGRRYPQGGGNPLDNGNVAVTATDVRHYPFRAFRGNGAFVSGIESAVRWINGNIN
jgi:hypothetical protein